MNKPVNILYAKFEYDSHNSSCHLLSAESRMYGFYVQIAGFTDRDEFKKQIDEWIRVFRNTKPAPDTNEPLIPGDPGARCRSNPEQGRSRCLKG